MVQVWKIAPGQRANHWGMCRDHDCILLGWRQLKDYRKFKSKSEILRALGGRPGDGAGAALSIMRFANEVKPSDIVVANQGRATVVGIGIVTSDYLPPGVAKNPSESKRLPHARLVDWRITDRLDLEPYFFGMSTVHALSSEKVAAIRQAYEIKYPKLHSTLVHLFAGVEFDKDDPETENLRASAEKELEEQGAFDPTGIEDARIRILSSIVRRQGQPAFRTCLLAAYSGRCAITGCSVEAVLEAAHIVPYKGTETNHPGNGLLLRADFHTLFDVHLISVHEDTMRLLVSPKLNDTVYEKFRGKKVRIPSVEGSRPSPLALKQHRAKSGLR